MNERRWPVERARAHLLRAASEVLIGGHPEKAQALSAAVFVTPCPVDDEFGFRGLLDEVLGPNDGAIDACVEEVYGPDPAPPLAAFEATLHGAGNGTDRFAVACSNVEGDQGIYARRTVIRDMIFNGTRVWVTVEPIQERT